MSADLVATGLEVSFGGVHALKGVDIAVAPGTIVGLIGRNGSGKSTLFNCVSGFVSPTAGRVRVGDVDVTGLPPHRAVRWGIARTFQTPRINPTASVLTAVMCGLYGTVRSSLAASILGLPAARREERALREQAETLIAGLGLADLRHASVGTLSLGLVRLVEVARCLASNARFVLLDEPAAGLTSDEQHRLAQQIQAVAAGGVGVLVVEHNIDLVRALCAHTTVLETGRVLCAGPTEDVLRHEEVVRSYLGAVAATAKEAA